MKDNLFDLDEQVVFEDFERRDDTKWFCHCMSDQWLELMCAAKHAMVLAVGVVGVVDLILVMKDP